MKQTCEIISIPRGYKIHEEITCVDDVTAFYDVLAGDKQFKCSRAELDGAHNVIKLTQHVLVCPHCAQRIPAYEHILNHVKPKRLFTRNDAYLWSSEVLSLFETENKRLDLFKPITGEETIKCIYCGCESTCSDKMTFISFRQKGHKITVTCPLGSISEIIRVNWCNKLFQIDELPLAESVTFNLSRGTAYLALRTASGKQVAIRDITQGLGGSDITSPIISLLAQNVRVKRKLRKLFVELWGKELPFKECELDIHKFTALTTFVGYDDVSFYSFVPYNSESLTVDKSFGRCFKRMHICDKLPDVYESSALPSIKSVRRRVFKRPELFFYLPELEALWLKTKGEPNFYCALLDSPKIFMILSFLHDYPMAFQLYELMAECGLHIPLRELLLKYPEEVSKYALYYASLSNYKREQAKKKIVETKGKCLTRRQGLYDYFCCVPDSAALQPTQVVDGFVFSPLKSKKDYINAGQQLNNCLVEAEFEDEPVIGVHKCGRYYAAIQVDVNNGMIVQAYLKNNSCINTDAHFYSVFDKWCRKNCYKYYEEMLFDD